ncbi:hypothetical protein [Kocuria sp.]|uniref:hypothetical protein n=1 Tax=Kocuria sp. TaxID=1871328 RepID=UPI0026DEA3AD|nr:hypothetical protein [Kocuria sp.]MDO5619687.1 hypothetical protein [Kocuria sp.]
MDLSPFHRLLRWYPRRWRQEHGPVLLGLLLDDAQAHGRSAPSTEELRAARIHGLGLRLDGPFALVTGLGALVTAITQAALTLFAPPLGSGASIWPLLGGLLFAAPCLLGLSVTALARSQRILSDGDGLLAGLLIIPAAALAALTVLSWNMGFQALDQGAPLVGLGRATVWLSLGAWVLGSAVLAVFLQATLSRTRLPRAGLVPLTVIGAGATTPILAFSLISPLVVVVLAATVSALSMGVTFQSGRVTPSVRPDVVVARRLPSARRVSILVFLCAAGSAVAVAYALSGSWWFGATLDSTQTMRHGIAASLLLTLPLLCVAGAECRRRASASTVWPTVLLAAAAYLATAIAYLQDMESHGSSVGFIAGAVCVGSAAAWLVFTKLHARPKTVRVAVAACAGIAGAASLGMLAIPMSAFAMPVVAVGLGI